MNPFDFLNSINTTKKDIMIDDISEKGYSPYIVNRSLSYFPDTVLIANEMNIRHSLDSKLQYHFLLNIIRKRKRFSKWAKAEQFESIDIIKQYYKCSNEKAKSILSLLNENQIAELKLRMYKGGKR